MVKLLRTKNLDEFKTNIKEKKQILLVEFDQKLKIQCLKKSFPKTKIE